MSKQLHGTHLGPVPELAAIFKHWRPLMSAADWLDYDDAPWWYNERASLSIFAGAIWKAKGSALEEFSMNKKAKEGKTLTSGRCDLWFSHGDHSYRAEAKPCWPALQRDPLKTWSAIEKAMTKAEDDARRLPKEKGTGRLAIVLASPRLARQYEDEMSDRLRSFCKKLPEYCGERTGCTWVFPEKAMPSKKPKRTGIRTDTKYYPGTMVVVRSLG